ncbi:MAG: TauD/TfdA family dioxygenase [Verrucomicrobiota bacterium]|nr:TauD/TfdA family dioxygenase [Verrucomicrobiota bacterium]
MRMRTQNGFIPSPYENPETFLKVAEVATKYLPRAVRHDLSLLHRNMLEENFVLFKGLPQDDNLPDTPGEILAKTTFVSEFCLSVFAKQLGGEPFNYIQEEKGVLFRNVRPTRVNEDQQTSDGSRYLLEWHTEQAFHPFNPDYLMLYCLRGDRTKQAQTILASLNKILPRLTSKTVEELSKPQYKTGIDVSFGNRDKTQMSEILIPVLGGSKESPTLTYDLDLMKAPTDAAAGALEEFRRVAESVRASISLESGDLVIFNNKKAIHGRTAFPAFYDGKDRWLQRVYLSTNNDFAQSVCKTGRVITTQF